MSKTFYRLFVLTILVASVAAAQPVIGGLKIGVPITDAFNIANNPSAAGIAASANDYTLGPYIEVKLPFKFSVEADALYRGYDFRAPAIAAHASSWDFPILAKYHFLKGPVKPYVAGGLDFSHLSDIPSFFAVNHSNNTGIVLGGGVQINLLVLRLSPEIRWTGDTLKSFSGVIDAPRNQVAFLLGIGF